MSFRNSAHRVIIFSKGNYYRYYFPNK